MIIPDTVLQSGIILYIKPSKWIIDTPLLLWYNFTREIIRGCGYG